MSLTIETASALLYMMYNSCEERNDKIAAEAIGVALECMRKMEDQKLKDYAAKEKRNFPDETTNPTRVLRREEHHQDMLEVQPKNRR